MIDDEFMSCTRIVIENASDSRDIVLESLLNKTSGQ